MWVKSKRSLEPVIESTLVTRDYIAVESRVNTFSFCSDDYSTNPFKRTFRAPMIQFLKVHRNHPLKVKTSHQIGVHIAPPNYPNPKDKRWPADLWRDKMDYDCISLVLIPFQIQINSAPEVVKRGTARMTSLENSFKSSKQGVFSSATLYYIPHGVEVSSDARKYGFIPASQVITHFAEWLMTPHPIFSIGNNLSEDSINEGDIRLPFREARRILADYGQILEERYKSRLMFKEFKRGIKEYSSPKN